MFVVARKRELRKVNIVYWSAASEVDKRKDEEKARAKKAIEKVIADREKMMGAIRSAQQEIILQEILSAVRENPMAGTCQIAKIIERDRKTTHRKLDDLEKDGRVTKVVIKGLLKWKEAQP